MLKFTKGLFALLGLVSAGLMVFFLVKMFWRYNNVVSMALANHGAMPADPKVFMWLAPAAALVTGLLLGIAIALPRRTARSIRHDERASYERQVSAAPVATHDADTRTVADPYAIDERR